MERSRSCSEKSSSGSSNSPAAASATGLRCYSASYVTSKNTKGTTLPCSAASSSSSSSSASSTSGGSKARMWSGGGLGAPSEMRRKRRVAGYRVYAVEGRVKGSLKSGVRWLKSKCTHMVDGWW